MTLDRLFATIPDAGPSAFGRWAEEVHGPLRASLRRFARAVDVEVVVQETFLRVWIRARDGGLELSGENASLRFALRVARLVALEELRRNRREAPMPEDPPELAIEPQPGTDPGMAGAIQECLEALPGKPKAALLARLVGGEQHPDRDLARGLDMQLNTFLQNVVRARQHMARCLENKGVGLRGIVA